MTLLDFSADSCDTPLRAFLVDVCSSVDQKTSLNIHSFLGGIGASFGYVLTAVNLNSSVFKYFGDDEKQILFWFVSVVFLGCLLITMTSEKEQPLKKLNKFRVGKFVVVSDCNS